MDVMGVDLGGTKIKIGVFNNDMKLTATYLFPTYKPVLQCLINAIQEVLLKHKNVQVIGIGTPGLIERTSGEVLFASENLPGWTGTKVKDLLETKFNLSVVVENDANVAALAEVLAGSAQDCKSALMLTLGTGVGGGIIVDGEILYGPNGAAGEFGHMILYPGGKKCSCGRNGCIEQYISGNAIKRYILESGLSMTPKELLEKKMKTPLENEILDAFIKDLAISISSLQAAFDMDILILGGGVSESAEHWIDLLDKKLEILLLNPLPIRLATLKNDAGMIGAAYLASKVDTETPIWH